MDRIFPDFFHKWEKSHHSLLTLSNKLVFSSILEMSTFVPLPCRSENLSCHCRLLGLEANKSILLNCIFIYLNILLFILSILLLTFSASTNSTTLCVRNRGIASNMNSKFPHLSLQIFQVCLFNDSVVVLPVPLFFINLDYQLPYLYLWSVCSHARCVSRELKLHVQLLYQIPLFEFSQTYKFNIPTTVFIIFSLNFSLLMYSISWWIL